MKMQDIQPKEDVDFYKTKEQFLTKKNPEIIGIL